MFSVNEFLDRAKTGAGIDSDYALAKMLGVNKANVSNWRNERAMPDERAILALCALSGDDPFFVAASIQSMRAANDDAGSLWRQMADKLKGVAVVGAVAVILSTVMPGEGALASPLDAAALSGLCVMSNLLRRYVMRLLGRMRHAHGGGLAA